MRAIVKPKKITSGDTVTVVAGSEPISSLARDKIERFFVKSGYKVKFPPNILKKIGDYVAGMPEERAADFTLAFSDSEIKAVFMAVGGFGASQILDQIDFAAVEQNPKIFAGYSDATTLQLAVFAKCRLVTFHSPNAVRLPEFKRGSYSLNNLWRMLGSGDKNIVIEPLSFWQEVVPGEASGILFGGNLSSLTSLLGTPWDPIVALPEIFGKEQKYLFFWEEVSEQFSDVMRSLWQVRNTGFFARVSGMIVGKLTDVAEKDYEDLPSKKALFREIAAPFGFPVIYGVDLGHDVPQATVPIGVSAQMDTAKREITILESVVS